MKKESGRKDQDKYPDPSVDRTFYNNISRERELVLGRGFEKKRMATLFGKTLLGCLDKANKSATGMGKPDSYDFGVVEPEITIATIGGIMETAAYELKEINKEVHESREVLQKLKNEIVQTNNLVEPELLNMIKRIRTTRMTVTTELNQSLSIMKDVRKFFLDAEYKTEIERLERFVIIGERMKVLIDDGTMDAVCDVMLKLSEKEEK